VKKLFPIGLITTTAAMVLLAYFYWTGMLRFNYPDKNEYPIVGIDISHHQGNIRWEESRNEIVSFVIIKTTEGGDYKDPLFKPRLFNSLEL
jgi:lysozyme